MYHAFMHGREAFRKILRDNLPGTLCEYTMAEGPITNVLFVQLSDFPLCEGTKSSRVQDVTQTFITFNNRLSSVVPSMSSLVALYRKPLLVK